MDQIENTENAAPVTFADMGLSPRLMNAVEAMGFTEPTEIQARAIPLMRTGADVIGRSQTGTGKTVAFGIPALEKIDPDQAGVQVLILCPTRELAQQGCEELKKLSRFMMRIYPVDVYGGAAMNRQIERLRRANLVIGTPGRVMDHMRRHTLKLDTLKLVVLDEADEMLSMGFREDMETILRETPENRQTVLFSATMPPEILAMTREFQHDPQLIEVNRNQITIDKIDQSYVEVPMGRKLDALCLLLRTCAPQRAMVFCNTKSMVDEVSAHLMQHGFGADGLHGDMQQSQRTRVMDAFKLGRTAVLVATDVAARGIDVNDVDYVFNYDIPQDPEYYVHRIGRTGRAGKSGVAITICSGRRQSFTMQQLARTVKSNIRRADLPSVNDAASTLTQRVMTAMEAQLIEKTANCASEWVQELLRRGYSAEQIAAAALQLQFGVAETRPEEVFTTVASKSGTFRRLRLNIGRSSHVAPNHLVAAVADRTGISGSEIGKIEIYDEYSLVAVPAEQAVECEHQMGGSRICGRPVVCELVEEEAFVSAPRSAGRGGRPRTPDTRNFSDAPRASRDHRPSYHGARSHDDSKPNARDHAKSAYSGSRPASRPERHTGDNRPSKYNGKPKRPFVERG